MTPLQNLFSDFINLSYTNTGINKIKLRDKKIVDYIISRLSNKGCSILYLLNGYQINIPWKWIDLFSSFITHSGDKINWENNTNPQQDIEDEDKIDITIRHMININYCINRCNSTIDSELLLSTLGEICSIKTKEFRKWCLETFNLKLEPIEVVSLMENVEI